MTRFVFGLMVGAVLVLGLTSAQGDDWDWGGGPAPSESHAVLPPNPPEPADTPSPTPPPEPPPTWVDSPMQAREGSYLASTGHCHAHQEIVQVFNPDLHRLWRSTNYRCRPER